MESQNYSNHTRWYPLFHFVLMPLLVLNLLSHLVRLVMDPSVNLAFWVVLSIALLLLAFTSRLMALQVQNRVIRLEERLRYRELLPPDLYKRAEALSVGQIVALRFASDGELAGLIDRSLNGEFGKNNEIKLAVKNWRGDYLRA